MNFDMNDNDWYISGTQTLINKNFNDYGLFEVM